MNHACPPLILRQLNFRTNYRRSQFPQKTQLRHGDSVSLSCLPFPSAEAKHGPTETSVGCRYVYVAALPARARVPRGGGWVEAGLADLLAWLNVFFACSALFVV